MNSRGPSKGETVTVPANAPKPITAQAPVKLEDLARSVVSLLAKELEDRLKTLELKILH